MKAVQPKRIGLVIVGMQPRYLSDIPAAEKEGIIAGIVDLARAGKRQKMPVAVVQYKGGGTTIAEALEAIAVLPHHTVSQGVHLDEFLRSHGVDAIILAGVHASCYVREVAEQAITAGYEVMTATDLVADNPIVSVRDMWGWYNKKTNLYPHSIELIGVRIG